MEPILRRAIRSCSARRLRRCSPRFAAAVFLLFLSRIHEKKGCDLLLRAFAKIAAEYPELYLVVAGPDPMQLESRLRTQADRAGIGHRVYWPGMLQGAAKYGAFRCAEAFVLPSHQENFGIVVAEALACGTPVLISDQVNIWREILESGVGAGPAGHAGGHGTAAEELAQPPGADTAGHGSEGGERLS